jgi:energy-coupling factor transporter ATP-binding protein EcfA2
LSNKNLPPLTSVIAKGPEAGFEFERLMKKLLIHDGSLKGYVFEPGSTYKDFGIDGIVKENYPGMKGPVVFQFKWLDGPINKGDTGRQIKESFDSLLNSSTTFNYYILVTPLDLTGTEKKWLESLPGDKKKRIAVHHFGHTHIQVLLDAYPALKKYYYGVEVGGTARDFKSIEEKYRAAIATEVKHLHFLGLPTGHYQRQQLLEKPELAKIYIPLDFIPQRDCSETTTVTLHEVLEKSPQLVVLGDPGSGKSTLAKYLAWVHSQSSGSGDKLGHERRVPFFIPIREFVRQQQERRAEAFNFIDFLKYKAEADYSFNDMDKDFFIALLELGRAIVLFDGLDEVASESGRTRTAQTIQQFSRTYPDSPVLVTSRLVGYTVDVKLDSWVFAHYRLAPVTPQQAGEFIAKWYDIQLPNNERLRLDRVQSLRRAIEINPGVQRLKTNPLLLTMMTLVHQFEGTLPDDRAKLYEKCLDLLLNTWQEQKYMDLGVENPLEERDLRYGDQLKMLADAAFYIQARNQGKHEDIRGMIEEGELAQVLFKARFNEKRMTEENARKDVRVFLDYIRERSGLLVEKGRNEKGENVFAFVHLSFLEYLCAYRIAEDKSKNQYDHIVTLLGYLEDPAWEEPILLALYLFDRSTGPSFIEAFSTAVFEKLTRAYTINGWFLLGRAVRDNLKFACEDMKRIIREILNLWLERRQEDMALAILKEIDRFSKEGENILKGVIIEAVKNKPVEKAFEFILRYKQLYEIDIPLLEALAGNKGYSTLGAYLPVYRENEIISEFIAKNLEESQWVTYYNSAVDKTNENLEKLVTRPLNLKESKGYIISHWAKLFQSYQYR